MKLLLVFAIQLVFISNIIAQCTVNTSASAMEITCGESVDLSAFGSSTGQVLLNETFNTGGFGPGWGSTPGATNFTNPCSASGVDGTTHAWMDNNTSVPRTLTSAPYNLSAATAGVSVCFDLLFAEQGNAAPCEGPDEPDEGVYLQYSIDGGATWVDIYYFDPNGGNDPMLTNWNNWCFELPAAAITSNTLIRWHQTADSGADYDHWGIDNVQIFQNDINSEIEWLHDGYSYGVGNPGGVNPTPVMPTTTTTYTAQMTTGSGAVCTNTITITVIDPVYDVSVSASPTNICAGDCSTISGTGQVIIDPGGLETYENNEFEVVASGNASVNINVQGINTSAITNGLIENVTINGFNFSGSFLCTNFAGCNCNGTPIAFGANCNITTAGFTVTLTSPGGCSIVLAPAGAASGNYNSTVFVPVGGTPIGAGFPAGGPWNPNQPFSTLNGCDPNGVWTLTFSAPGLGFGFGTLSGWSITFNDPPIYAPVDYSWSPTNGLSDPNNINTQACPLVTTNYVLTVSNGTPGCATHTENVQIVVDPCGCVPPAVTVLPLEACAPATFDLSEAIDPGSDPAVFSYHATFLDAQNDINPISTSVSASGTYFVRYETPGDPSCFGVLQIDVTISNGDDASFTLTDFCAGSANSATGIATPGGTFTFNPAPADGATIDPNTGEITGSTTGTTYTVEYTTNGLCPASSTETVSASGFSFTTVVVDASCGANDGEITFTPNGGTGPYSYSLDGGAAQPSGLFTGLGAGLYDIEITDFTGCVATGNESVASSGGPSIDNLQVTNPTCAGGGCDGSITATVSGGTAPYTYQWYDNLGNPIGTNSATISNLCAGDYSVEVTDAAGGSNQLFFEDFESAAAGWTLNVPMGAEGADPNYFETDDDEGGVAVGGCGIAGNGDATLHITSVFFPGGGAAYDAGGLCGILFCPETNRQAESPLISTVGQTGLTLNFDYIAQGDIPNDQATVWYNAGSGWVQLGGALFSGTGACAPQGIWTAFSSPLPAACENIANLQIAIRWVNNDDGVGTDPSVAVNNMEIVTAGTAACPSTDFATLTAPAAADDPSFTLTDFCAGGANAASGIVTPGGTFTFNPLPMDGATINASTGEITNGVPGTTYSVEYTTAGSCSASEVNTVTVTNGPTVSFTSDPTTTCAEASVVFTNTSVGSVNCVWAIEGFPDQVGCGSITQIFTQQGTFDVTLTITDASGCTNSLTSQETISFASLIDASFNVNVTEQSTMNPVFNFTNTSTNETSYEWHFGDGTTSTVENPTHTYPGVEGSYTVILIVENSLGCIDSAMRVVTVADELIWFVPNAFTPDGDENNNMFLPIFGPGFDEQDYSFLIFNRWGEIIFESKDMSIGWDGSYHGKLCKEGVYTYKIVVKEMNVDKRHEIVGHLNLLK